MKKYHVTYFLKRESENGPLLSGITVEAANMILAIYTAMTAHGVPEDEIKYVIEL